MVTDLIKHERIRTTLGKAKVVSSCVAVLSLPHAQRTIPDLEGVADRHLVWQLKRLADKVVTLGKKATLNAKRECMSILRTTDSVHKVLDVLGPRYAEREGGHPPPTCSPLPPPPVESKAVRVSLQMAGALTCRHARRLHARLEMHQEPAGRQRPDGLDRVYRPVRAPPPPHLDPSHPGGNPGANLKSISHRCHTILVAFVWELTKETIDLPPRWPTRPPRPSLQGQTRPSSSRFERNPHLSTVPLDPSRTPNPCPLTPGPCTLAP